MGDSSGSMFYLVAIFLVIYIAGMAGYLLVQKIRKMRSKRK